MTPRTSAPASSPQTSPRACVLIVDDQASLRRSLCWILQGAGYATCEAAHGQDGLTRLDEHVVDGVLLDLEMPVMSGLEMLRQLRPQHPDLPVIVLSGSHDDEDLQHQARQAGATAVVAKPFQVTELLQVCARLIPNPPRRS